MAAILYDGMNQMCHTTSAAVAAPLCGATAAITAEQDTTMTSNSTTVSCCSKSCQKSLACLQQICTNPFGMFVTTTVVTNVPPMMIALSELSHFQENDGKVCKISVWLLINFLFCWVHIVASIYIAVSIHQNGKRKQSSSKKQQQQQQQKPQNDTVLLRASNLFLYDPVMAVYLALVVLYILFISIPNIFFQIDTKTNSTTNNNDDGDDQQQQEQYGDDDGAYDNSPCSIYIHEKVIATVGFAWAFLSFGFGALALSFGFAYVDAHRQPTKHHHHRRARDTMDNDNDDEEEEPTCTDDDDDTQTSGYTTMEEGYSRQQKWQSTIMSTSKENMSASNDPEYMPPQPVLLADTTSDVMSSTEETANTRRGVKSNTTDDDEDENGFTTEVDTVGFVTDLETDVEDVHLARTGRRGRSTTSQRNNINNARHFRHQKINSDPEGTDGEETDGNRPTTSYELQTETEGGFTTDDAGFTTEYGRSYYTTEAEGEQDDSSVEYSTKKTTRKIKQNRSNDDKSNNNNTSTEISNLDVLMALSQDPTVSIGALTDPASTTDDEDYQIRKNDSDIFSSEFATTKQRRERPAQIEPGRHGTGEQSLFSEPLLKQILRLVSDETTDDERDGMNGSSTGARFSARTAMAMSMEPLSFVDGGGGGASSDS